jgi:hypothetical protein
VTIGLEEKYSSIEIVTFTEATTRPGDAADKNRAIVGSVSPLALLRSLEC